jgi:hypothetical protein
VIVMDFDSVPSGARVTLDGKRIGTTPLRGIEVPLGAHRLRVRHGKVRGSRPIDVSRSGPTRYTWHRDADQWTAAY